MRKKNYNHHRLGLIYRYLIKYKLVNQGNSPTLRDMCSVIGVDSTSLIIHYLDDLAGLGLIKRSNQGIEIVGARWVAPENYDTFLRGVG